MLSKFRAGCRGVIGSAVVQVWLICFCLSDARAGAVFYGPSGYLSFTNSPFDAAGFEFFHLESFEDGLLNTPGVVVNTGWMVIGPGTLTDSVDADDGLIDGSGAGGYSLLSGGVHSNLVVTFDTNSLGGHLPTHVGVVCTDVGAVAFGEFCVGDVTLTALDATGGVLGSITATNLGNGAALGSGPGATSEDRFFGVSNPGGISSITLSVNNSVDWEVDHLQYGFQPAGFFVPELRIRQSAPNEVSLTWSTNAIGFILQESPSLSGTNWTTVPIAPTIVCEKYRVIATPSSSKRFYRLLRP